MFPPPKGRIIILLLGKFSIDFFEELSFDLDTDSSSFALITSV
jgi:hypothetical protein